MDKIADQPWRWNLRRLIPDPFFSRLFSKGGVQSLGMMSFMSSCVLSVGVVALGTLAGSRLLGSAKTIFDELAYKVPEVSTKALP